MVFIPGRMPGTKVEKMKKKSFIVILALLALLAVACVQQNGGTPFIPDKGTPAGNTAGGKADLQGTDQLKKISSQQELVEFLSQSALSQISYGSSSFGAPIP